MSGYSDVFREVMFWVFATAAVLPALFVLFSREIVHMAFWLLLSLAGFAGIYLQIGAAFLGFTQVVVYIGGILILLLFGIMLTEKLDVPLRERRSWVFVLPGVIVGFFVSAGLMLIAVYVPWKTAIPGRSEFVVREIGANFMSTFVLPFEAVSVMLLVAMVGASYMVRRDSATGKEASLPSGAESSAAESQGGIN